MQTKITHQTEQVLQNHLQAAGRGDVDAIVADYAEDAIFFTPDGILCGKDEIRAPFKELVADFPPGPTVEIQQQIADGELAYSPGPTSRKSSTFPSPPTP